MPTVSRYTVTVCWLDRAGNHSRTLQAVGLTQQEAANHALRSIQGNNNFPGAVGFTVTDIREVVEDAGRCVAAR